jgi:hypothetical protein
MRIFGLGMSYARPLVFGAMALITLSPANP